MLANHWQSQKIKNLLQIPLKQLKEVRNKYGANVTFELKCIITYLMVVEKSCDGHIENVL